MYFDNIFFERSDVMKYYLIPIVEENIKLEGKSLYDIAKEYYPRFMELESQRVNLIYSTRMWKEMPHEKLDQHHEKTTMEYRKAGLPKYLVAVGNDHDAREIFSGLSLVSDYDAALGIRSVSKEEAAKYMEESHYVDNVVKYLAGIKVDVKKEETECIYDGVVYLDGELDGEPYNGRFKGKILTMKKPQ